jgi:anti-anti-sigma factor
MNALDERPVLDRLPLDIGVQRLVGLVEVALDGRLDEHTVDGLRSALDELLAAGAVSIELDLTELVDCDGFGLALLLAAHRHLRATGGELVLRHTQPAVLDRLRAAALHDVLVLAA